MTTRPTHQPADAPPLPTTSPTATIGAASFALATTIVPVFLVGALSPAIGAELGFDESATGLVVTAFYLAAALTAVPLGRLTERAGGRTAMQLGVLISAAGCLLAAVLVQTWWQLALLLALLGAMLPLVDTGIARAFATAVAPQRRGIAFGIKEASVPLASLLAGLAVPVLGATVGWRGAFVVGVVVGPTAALLLRVVPADGAGLRGARPTRRRDTERTRSARTPLSGDVRRLGLSFALAGAGAAAAVTFLVPAAVHTGMSAARAGLVLAVASAGGIVARLLAGVIADRRPALLGPVLVGAMVLGAVGTTGFALTTQPLGFVVLAVITLTAGWGWTGLGFAALTQAAPEAPATAAGAGVVGLALGGTVGPLVFGQVVAAASYRLGWALLTLLFLAGAGVAASALRADRRRSAT